MLQHKGTIRIETPRLILRRLTEADAVSVHRNWGSDPEVYRYMTSPIMPALSDVEEFIDRKRRSYENPAFYYWGLTLKDPAQQNAGVIGMATLTEVSDFCRTANLAYTIGKPWWGNGYATEAAKAVTDFAFAEVGVHKLYGCHFTDNPRSGHVLLAVGMKFLGTSEQPVLQNGEYLTYDSYELTARAWRRKNGRGGWHGFG